MSDPAPAPEPDRTPEAEAHLFQERLRQTGQLVDVAEGDDTSQLPAHVTHVRYPDGTVKRIRFTGPGHR
ncbi:hypothetical protein [Frigoriglobus tundricola]|uniref:Uncharacterized protein n=1 Tax=Frigoriglobus tundricola TaxID=2774151 RepID=A0A6M5YV54_9BACT|nr:hypothetical protein [Frigoriglobus tundricola]QJW97344.1 hypothetical protein FTUN_4915 [Frigoriglobus tundricola]